MKSKKNLILTVIVFSYAFLKVNDTQAQNMKWASSIGGEGSDISNSITTDASGNIYTTGLFQGTVDFDPSASVFNLTSIGNDDVFITKQDASGNFKWAKQIGGQGFERGNSIITDDAGNIYTTGYFDGTADFNPNSGVFNLTADGQINVFISKLDENGNFIWAKNYGGSYGFGSSISIDNVGNIYTCGSFTGTVDFDPNAGTNNLTSFGEKDIFICKLNSGGNFVWVKQMGGIKSDYCNDISIDNAAGGIYTTGYFESTADFNPSTSSTFNLTSKSEYDCFISKLDTAGKFTWAKSIGGVNWEIAKAITTDLNGNVYTTGNFSETVDFDPNQGVFNLISSEGSNDIFILKLNTTGNFVWAKQMGGTSTDEGNSIITDALGNLYTTGYFRQTADFNPNSGIFNLNSAGGFDAFVSKLDGDGNFIWAKSIGSFNSDYGKDIILKGDALTVIGSYQETVDFDPNLDVFNLTSNGVEDAFVLRLNLCAARVTISQKTLTANQQQGATYQWINCDNKQAIIGENKRIFTPKSTGNYSVIVSTSSCSDTSSCVNVSLTGVNNAKTSSFKISIYPNPNNGKFVLEANGINTKYDITITDILGKLVYSQQNQNPKSEIDLSVKTNGTYFIQIKTENEVFNQKVIVH